MDLKDLRPPTPKHRDTALPVEAEPALPAGGIDLEPKVGPDRSDGLSDLSRAPGEGTLVQGADELRTDSRAESGAKQATRANIAGSVVEELSQGALPGGSSPQPLLEPRQQAPVGSDPTAQDHEHGAVPGEAGVSEGKEAKTLSRSHAPAKLSIGRITQRLGLETTVTKVMVLEDPRPHTSEQRATPPCKRRPSPHFQ